MKLLGRLSWTVPAVAIALSGVAAAGCQAEVEVATPKPPPPPPPPPPDQDGDGIPDMDDKCPAEPEDGNPPDPNDGCPNKDMDNDGIPIPQDKCPDQPETVNEYQDDDGCPDEKPVVELKEKEVKINQKIMFEKDKAELRPESMKVIDAVAEVLKNNSEVQLVEVGGHASKEGADWYNRNLTQKRVDSVVEALKQRGIEESRLIAQGYGYYCRLAEGDTPEAHEKNRRVEFKIIYRKGEKLDQERGCEAAKEAGIKPKKLPPVPEWKGEEKPGEGESPEAGPEGAKPAPAESQPAGPSAPEAKPEAKKEAGKPASEAKKAPPGAAAPQKKPEKDEEKDEGEQKKKKAPGAAGNAPPPPAPPKSGDLK